MSNHDLTKQEMELSAKATKELGYRAIVFRDGRWICQPVGDGKIGYGVTPEDAIKDCKELNAKH